MIWRKTRLKGDLTNPVQPNDLRNNIGMQYCNTNLHDLYLIDFFTALKIWHKNFKIREKLLAKVFRIL